MSWPYWLGAAVIVLLLCLAFRRKRVADEIREFDSPGKAIAFYNARELGGHDCFISRISRENEEYESGYECVWQVRCYRRKERQE